MSSSSDTRVHLIPTSITVGISLLVYYYINRRPASPKSPESPTIQQEDGPKKHISASDAIHLIQTRRSIFPKQYTGHPIPPYVISDMLEAARWSPTHNLTEPWRFIVFQSVSSRKELGQFLASQYKNETPEDKFVEAKFHKKMTSVERASHVIAICVQLPSKNPLMEEICSVAMAVQNMHLVATAHKVGAYWSTGGIYQKTYEKTQDTKDAYHLARNPTCLKEYLNLEDQLCMGWFYVGSYWNPTQDVGSDKVKCWPSGRRKAMDEECRVTYR